MNFHGCYSFVFIFDFKKVFSHMLPFLPPENIRKPLFLWCIQKRQRKNVSLKRNTYFCRHFFCNVEKHDVSVIPELVIRKVSLKRNICFCRHFFCNVENHDVSITCNNFNTWLPVPTSRNQFLYIRWSRSPQSQNR